MFELAQFEFWIYPFRFHSRDWCRNIAISSLFRCQEISEKREIDNLTFFGINLTLFDGENDMCLKNTNLPCEYQIDPGSVFSVYRLNKKKVYHAHFNAHNA